MAEPRLYFIGGASGAGKTASAKALSLRFNVPCVELDDLQTILMPMVPAPAIRERAMRRGAKIMVRALLATHGQSIVEGAWLEPHEARDLSAEFGDAFHPVFCGYSGADIPGRYADLKARGEHWLTREPTDSAHAFLKKQVRDSDALRDACHDTGLRYIDFTDIPTGYASLEGDFRSWLRERLTATNID